MTPEELPPYLRRFVDTGCCWLWTGPVQTKHTAGGRVWRAVYTGPWGTQNAGRAMYRAWYGVVLDSTMMATHTCDQPLCVNPAHLKCGTARSNSQDAKARGRLRPGGGGDLASPDHCCSEHVFAQPTHRPPALRPHHVHRCREGDRPLEIPVIHKLYTACGELRSKASNRQTSMTVIHRSIHNPEADYTGPDLRKRELSTLLTAPTTEPLSTTGTTTSFLSRF